MENSNNKVIYLVRVRSGGYGDVEDRVLFATTSLEMARQWINRADRMLMEYQSFISKREEVIAESVIGGWWDKYYEYVQQDPDFHITTTELR